MLLKETKLDPRVTRTRQLLEAAFVDLLKEKGFQAVTVQDIAERATVNRATFYAHFEDKYALLDHVIRDSFQTILDAKLPPDAAFSPDNLKVLILAVCEYLDLFHNHQCQTSTKPFAPLIEQEVQRQVYQVVIGWVDQLQGNKSGPAAVPTVIASTVSWAIFGAGIYWAQASRDSQKQLLDPLTDQVLALITGGLVGVFQSEQ